MTTIFIKDDIIAQIDKLPYNLQLRVLDFAKTLMPKGVDGKSLLRFEGTISADDLHLISKAIEEDCERVDTGEW
jgi:dihydroorotase-like cyclic amidohydrolase